MLLLNYYYIKKQSSKKNLVKLVNPNNFKVIIMLLIKLIAI